MITQERIEELGLAVSDAKMRLSVATERLNETLIQYWHQETGAAKGDKFMYNGKIVMLNGFYIQYGKVRVSLAKVKKDGTASLNDQYNFIDRIEDFKRVLTKL